MPRAAHRSSCSSSIRSVGMAAAAPASVLSGCRLTYFGIPGRAEAIRLALAVGGVDFEDERIPFPAWPEVKPATPWVAVPVLELADGSTLRARGRMEVRGFEVQVAHADAHAGAGAKKAKR